MKNSRLAFGWTKGCMFLLITLLVSNCFSRENPKWGSTELQSFALQIPFTASHHEVGNYLRRQGVTDFGYAESSRTITAIMRETRSNMIIIESVQFTFLFSEDDHLTELRVKQALTGP
jgi:hypothetical protein